MGLLGGIVSAIGGPLVGGILGNSSSNKASKKAAQIAADTADKNNALFRETRDLNTANLAPFMQRGNVAGAYYNAMLGLPSTPTGAIGGTAASGADADAQAKYLLSVGNSSTGRRMNAFAASNPGMEGNALLKQLLTMADSGERDKFNAYAAQNPYKPGTAGAGELTKPVTQQDAQNAFGSYIKGSDYGFQFGTGSNALNTGYAAQGTLQSGAAMKALEKYRQNLQSGYRGEYLGHLSGQQNMGMTGASALAGVGNTFASNTANSNTSAGTAAANSALQIGSNNAQFYGAMGSLLPKMASSFMGGGFGG